MPVTTAVVVENRTATRTIPALNMSCDHREIPESPLVGSSADYWIAGICSFEGSAAFLGRDGMLAPGGEAGGIGTLALGTGAGHLVGIVSANEATNPAVWIAARLADLQVTTEGQVGVFRKRPQQIQVKGDGWELYFGQVYSFERATSQRRAGQEASLLSALMSGGAG